MKRDNGFTMVDLVWVVCAVFVLVVAVMIIIPFDPGRGVLRMQAMCGTNLNSIGKAILLYQADNDDLFPDHTATGRWKMEAMGGTAETPYALDSNPLQSLNLLVYTGHAERDLFRCPSAPTGGTADRGAADRKYGFYCRCASDEGDEIEKETFIDYALHLGSAKTTDGRDNPARFHDDMDGGIVILADRPTPGKPASAWSINHPEDGENVLRASCSVRFSKDEDSDTDRNLSGWGENNIYVKDMDSNDVVGDATDASPVTWAESQYDSVLFWRGGE